MTFAEPTSSPSKIGPKTDLSDVPPQQTTPDFTGLPAYYPTLLNGLHDAVIVIDREYRIVDVNDPMLHKTNFTRDQVIGRHCYEISHNMDTPCWQDAHHPCPVLETWQKEARCQATHTHFDANGKPFFVEIATTPLKDKHGRIVGAVEAQQDISLEKQLESRLAAIYKLGQELTLMQDEMSVIQHTLETAVKYLQYNCASCALVDEEEEKLIYRYYCKDRLVLLKDLAYLLTDNHHPPVSVINSRKAAHFTNGFHINNDYRPTNPVICIPLLVKGKAIGVLNVENNKPAPFAQSDQRLLQALADQTAVAIANAQLHGNLKEQLNIINEAQAQLIRNEKLAAIGELVAGVAHELNNPLAAVVLYSQLLQRKTADLDLQDDLKIIVAEAKRASKVIRGLLDFARQRPPERKQIQLNDVLQTSLNLLDYTMQTHNIRLKLNLLSELPLTMADPYQLQQVFINIMNNALQAMEQQKERDHCLSVSSEYAPPQFPGPRSTRENMIRVSITDNGPGIPTDLLPRVFDPFFTTKAPGQGTGMGLSVCHGIISEHGGHIWVESELGQWTAVHIELPVINSDSLQKQTGPLMGLPFDDGQELNARILILDDEESLRQILTETLKREGYQVDAVADGDTAFSRLHQFDYDLILCDIRMPGMNGIEFYRLVESLHPRLLPRFVFTTGDAVSQDTKNFLEKTGVPYLVKPFDLPVLAIRLKRELHRVAQLAV